MDQSCHQLYRHRTAHSVCVFEKEVEEGATGKALTHNLGLFDHVGELDSSRHQSLSLDQMSFLIFEEVF